MAFRGAAATSEVIDAINSRSTPDSRNNGDKANRSSTKSAAMP
jgi:hypothetical protein